MQRDVEDLRRQVGELQKSVAEAEDQLHQDRSKSAAICVMSTVAMCSIHTKLNTNQQVEGMQIAVLHCIRCACLKALL